MAAKARASASSSMVRRSSPAMRAAARVTSAAGSSRTTCWRPSSACPTSSSTNTGISTYIWIVTNRKRKERRGRVQLINGTDFAWKMKKSLGDKRKQIGDGTEGMPNHNEALTKLYGDFADDVRLSVAAIHTNVD